MGSKTEQLQIRVSPEQKRRLKQLARAASLDVSSFVLSRVLPDESEQFQEFAGALRTTGPARFAFAELADYLQSLPPGAFQRAVSAAPKATLAADRLNYLAGAIELASQRRGLPPPAWTTRVAIPEEPAFGSALTSVRLHLLTRAPVALRRRNLFVDASLDDRV